MQGHHLTLPFHIPGALTANITLSFKLPFPVTIKHISAVASNNSDATLRLGTPADDDGYLPATPIGDNGTPAEFTRPNFTGALCPEPGQCPKIPAGATLVATLDYDGSSGASGAAAQNVTILLTLLE